MKSSMNIYEKKVVKYFKKLGFQLIEKLDDRYKDVPAPDLLFKDKDNYELIVEVKSIAKFPKKENPIKINGQITGYHLNSPAIIDNLMYEVDKKYQEVSLKNSKYTRLPYALVVFELTSYWNGLGLLNDDLYKIFPNISATMRFVKYDPKSHEWEGLSSKELAEYINEFKDVQKSRERYRLQIFINKYARNKIDVKKFGNVEIVN